MHNATVGVSVGTKLNVIVTEPWGLVTGLSSPLIGGYAFRVEPLAALVIKLDKRMSIAGKSCENLLARPRRTEDVFLEASGKILCSLISVSDTEAEQEGLIQLTDFDGRLMLMGDVSWESSHTGDIANDLVGNKRV